MWYHNIRSVSFSFVTIHASDGQTDGRTDGQIGRTEFRLQYRVLHYMQSHGNKTVCGPVAPDQAGRADGAPSDPLVDWEVRYTVPISFLSTFLSWADLRPRIIGGSLMGFGVWKSPVVEGIKARQGTEDRIGS